MTDQPKIQLDFTKDFCARHLEPFREEWPKGAAYVMMMTFDRFMADERVRAMAPKGPDGLAEGDDDTILMLMGELRPLCCFIPEEEMQEIIAEALAGAGPRLEALRARNK